MALHGEYGAASGGSAMPRIPLQCSVVGIRGRIKVDATYHEYCNELEYEV